MKCEKEHKTNDPLQTNLLSREGLAKGRVCAVFGLMHPEQEEEETEGFVLHSCKQDLTEVLRH